MKKLLIMALLMPSLAFAKPVSFDFNGVSLVAFSQATFKSVMGRDFVISPDVLAADRKITMSVKNIDTEDVPAFVENILQQQNISVALRNGVYYLTPVRQQDAVAISEKAHKGAQMAHAFDAALSGKQDGGEFPQFAETRIDQGVRQRQSNDESWVYSPNNRPAEFLVTVVNTTFGSRAAMVSGSRLVLTGGKAELDKMIVLLDSLDVLPSKVDVAISWVEVTQSSGASRGISLIANVLGAKLGVSLGSVNTATAISLKSANFDLVIDALNTDSRFKQVSNSRVIGDEYQSITLTVGDETPTVASAGKDNAGNLVQNIVYRPSGVIVDVLPKVLGSGRIHMAIDGQISSFKATQTGVSGSPTLSKRQVKTTVTVADGEVLLIGGLNESRNSNMRSGLPFLPASWSLASDSSANTDLVLVLSASVAK